MTDLIERLRKMPCGSPECDGGAIPHGPTPDGHWEAEQCQICAYIKEAADELERLESLYAAEEESNKQLCERELALALKVERLEGALDTLQKRMAWINTDISYKAPEQVTVVLFADYLDMIFGDIKALDKEQT